MTDSIELGTFLFRSTDEFVSCLFGRLKVHLQYTEKAFLLFANRQFCILLVLETIEPQLYTVI